MQCDTCKSPAGAVCFCDRCRNAEREKVRAEVRQEVARAWLERDALREAVLDVLIEHQHAMPEDARARLRKAVGRVE